MEHLKNCVILDRKETKYDKPVYMPPSVESVEYDLKDMKKTNLLLSSLEKIPNTLKL